MPLPADVRVRCATPDDIATICDFRSRMFAEMGWTDEQRVRELETESAEYLRGAFATGAAAGWLAAHVAADGAELRPVGSAVLAWKRVPPSLRNPDGREAYLLGVFVVPERRRQGIARELVNAVIAQATAEGASLVTLHASDEGRKLYETLGFVDSHEMRLFTRNAPAPAWTPAYDAD